MGGEPKTDTMSRVPPKLVTSRLSFRASKALKETVRAFSGQTGISLLEVLFGAAVAGVAAIGIGMMFGLGQSLVQAGGDDRAALSIAQQRLEQVRAAGFGPSTLPDPREETADDGVPIDNLQAQDDVPGFRRRTIITGVCPTNFAIPYNAGGCPSSPNLEAKLVTVMVRFKGMSSNDTNPKTTPVILTTVLVKK